MRLRMSRQLLGLTYLVVIALLLALTIGIYNKSMPWQSTATVTLTTTTPGLELNPLSDVKFQGVRVGEVREISTDGTAAVVRMALDEDMLELIPANVDAAILPKTLFGEKYVDLRSPELPQDARLADGGQIEQSTTSVELGRVFSRLVPILRTLEPELVSSVLTSLADAVDGRGSSIARTLNQLDGFLEGVEPSLETFADDLDLLASTADVYAAGTDDLAAILDGGAAISAEVLTAREDRIATFLEQAVSSSALTAQVVRRNTENLVRLSGRSRPVLALLEEYSTSIPCLIDSLRLADIATGKVSSYGPFVNLTVDMVANQTPYVFPDDLPSNPDSDANNANLPDAVPSFEPHCAEAPSYILALDTEDDTTETLPLPTVGGAEAGAGSGTDVSAQVVEARLALARALAARLLGSDAGDVPAYAELLLAPMVADGEVAVP